MKRSMHRIGASVMALGIASTLSLAVAPPIALAQEAPTAVTAPASLIDFSKRGSITLFKSDAPEGERGDGNALEETPKNPLQGIDFALYKVMDITDAATFNEASALTAPGSVNVGEGNQFPQTVDVDGKSATLVESKATDSEGKITWGDLAVGAYLVVEGQPTGDNAAYAAAKPYLVYVPMTNPANQTTWNYDPVTYPKNSKSEVTKEVKDADKNASDKITYTIKSDIPAVTSKNVSKYIVQDDLDEDNVSTTADDIVVKVANIANDEVSNEETLQQGSDYTVDIVEGTQEVTITFLQPGLEKLTERKRENVSAKVITEINATVKEVGTTDGVAINKAKVIHNNPSSDGDVERESNEVKTYWAKIRIDKEGKKAGEETKKLAGAVFDVYRCEAPETGKPTLGDKLDAFSGVETNDQGEAIIDGLHVTNLEDGDKEINKAYCLVETKAPEGFELLTEPVVVRLNQGELTQEEGDTAAVSMVAKIENIESNKIKLPLTGGAGIYLLAALGIAIIVGGTLGVRYTTRRS